MNARTEFLFLIGRHSTLPANKAQRILHYALTLQRLAEKQCNDPSWSEADEEKRARIKAKVSEMCLEHGTAARFSNDPRGNVLKIQVPDGYTNDWGREGICVPTS